MRGLTLFPTPSRGKTKGENKKRTAQNFETSPRTLDLTKLFAYFLTFMVDLGHVERRGNFGSIPLYFGFEPT